MEFNNFSWNFAHVSYLTISPKGCPGFYIFCLELELLAKIKKYLISTHSPKPGLSIAPDLKNILKNPEHTFIDIGK